MRYRRQAHDNTTQELLRWLQRFDTRELKTLADHLKSYAYEGDIGDIPTLKEVLKKIHSNYAFPLTILSKKAIDLGLPARDSRRAVQIYNYWKHKMNSTRMRFTRDPKKVSKEYLRVAGELDRVFDDVVFLRKIFNRKHETKVTKAGCFEIVNSGGFSDSEMMKAAKFVTMASFWLKSSGFSKACHGKIYLVPPNMEGQRAVAFYTPATDKIYVNPRMKSADPLRSLLHELGHRFMYKTPGMEKAAKRIFDAIKKERIPLEPGMTFQDKSGSTFVIEKVTPKDVTFHPTSLSDEYFDSIAQAIYKQYHITDPAQKQSIRDMLLRNPEKSLRQTLPMDKFLLYYTDSVAENNPEWKSYITPYAATDAVENFAEMFAYYCLGELSPALSLLFEQNVFGPTQ